MTQFVIYEKIEGEVSSVPSAVVEAPNKGDAILIFLQHRDDVQLGGFEAYEVPPEGCELPMKFTAKYPSKLYDWLLEDGTVVGHGVSENETYFDVDYSVINGRYLHQLDVNESCTIKMQFSSSLQTMRVMRTK